MNEFDRKAREWDANPMHWERSEAVVKKIIEMVPLNKKMKALEFGAGTGILSFLLQDHLSEIIMMDSSQEMVNVMHEKVTNSELTKLKPLQFDLEHSDYHAQKFDCIFLQMVLHHIAKTEQLLYKFYNLLNPGGFLAIADLYLEDGSFHGEEFKGFNGFDTEQLSKTLEEFQFSSISYETCFIIKRDNGKEYPVFLMVANKAN